MRIPRGLVALLAAAACAAPVSLSMAQAGGSVEGQAAVHLVEAEKHTAAGDYRAAIIELKNAVLEAPRSPRLRYRLGNVYAEIGDLGSAQKELERAVDLDPEWIEARLALGEVWLSLGETDRVVNELWAAEAPAGAQRAQVYVLHGLAQLEDGDIDAARESFRAALEEHPDDGPAYLGMARAALAEGDLSMAELHLENAEQGVGAEQAQVLRLKGDLALNRRDYGAAEEAFRKVVESNPHRAWARRDLARALIELGKLDEADRHLDEVLEARPKDYDAVFLKGYSAYRQGDFASALERMSAVLAVADKFAPALYVSGASALAIGQNERARRDLGRFMQMEPADRPGRRLYAEALLRLGDASEAYTVLRPLAEARPGDPAVLALLGTAAVMSGDVGAGLEHLERAAALAPADDGMRARVAAARLAATEREEGLRELERLIQEQPDIREFELAVLRSYVANREFAKAIEAARRYQRRYPDRPEGWALEGIALVKTDRAAEAETAFRQALELSPGYPDAGSGLAEIRVREGRLDAAREVLVDVLKVHPDHVPTLRNLAEVERLSGRDKEAVAWLEKALAANQDSLETRIALARLHVTNRRPLEALEVLATSSGGSGDPGMLSVRGEAELLAGRPQAAVQTFRDLVAATPQRADAHVALAEAQESAGDISAAKDSVDRALALDPNNRAARVAHARLRLLSLPVPVPDDKANAALNEVTTLASAYPGDAGVAKVRAIAALVVGKPEVAADLLRSVYDATNDGATAVQLASLKGQLGQGQEGLDLLRGHLERFPGDVRARRGLARLLEVSGNPEAAAAQREKAGM